MSYIPKMDAATRAARRAAIVKIEKMREQSLREYHDKLAKEQFKPKPAPFKYFSVHNQALFQAFLKDALAAYFRGNPDASEWTGGFPELYQLLKGLDMPADGKYRFALQLPEAQNKEGDATWTFTRPL